MRVVVLLGAPGVGKGTVAGDIARQSSWQHVSTGDLLRDAVGRGSPAGKQAQSYMDSGELVPDDVVLGVLRERLAQSDGDYLLDGFPRTAEQAEMLDGVLTDMGTRLGAVCLLEVSEKVLIQRLSGRRVCPECGRVFHVTNIPPAREGICDACGAELIQRSDDHPETIRNRLEVYRRQTEPLVAYYDRRKLMSRINAEDREETVGRVLSLLGALEAEQ